MLDQAGPVLDQETGIFKVVRYFGGPGLDCGPDRSKSVQSASLILIIDFISVKAFILKGYL